jgi:uncharacterized coiled-coil protein SlyX
MPPAEKPELADRLMALEERLTFYERTVEDLSEALLRHERRIEQLTLDLRAYTSSVERLLDNASHDLPHEKPPHY